MKLTTNFCLFSEKFNVYAIKSGLFLLEQNIIDKCELINKLAKILNYFPSKIFYFNVCFTNHIRVHIKVVKSDNHL